MTTLTKTVTGRESLGDILGGFTKLTKRLDTFIGQRSRDAEKFAAAELGAKAARSAAIDDIERASRTKAKIADLVA